MSAQRKRTLVVFGSPGRLLVLVSGVLVVGSTCIWEGQAYPNPDTWFTTSAKAKIKTRGGNVKQELEKRLEHTPSP